MHILFTRPLEDSKEIISRFQNLGHKVSHLPVLNIKEKKHEKINFSNYSAAIFTSANSIKYLKSNNIDKNIICFCVGEATERKASSFGFQNIFSAEGNVHNLKEIILRHYKYTNSQKAKKLVDDFDRFEPYFWLVLPAASNIHDLLKATTANAA